MAAFTGSVGSLYSGPGTYSQAAAGFQSSFGGTFWDQTPYLRVEANGVPLDNALSANIVLGLDLQYATATIELDSDPVLGKNALIEVWAGTGPNNVKRFSGRYQRTRANMWPHTYSLICNGRLSLAAQFKQSAWANVASFIAQAVNQRVPVVGVSMFDLLPNSVCTDQNYVTAVLHRVPGLDFDPNDIGGTGHIFGTLAYRELTWAPGVDALSQAHKLDEVSLGYRLTESLGGRIRRVRVAGYPSGSPDVNFVEGYDIWEATGERSIEDLINASYVEGYALGGKPGIFNAFIQQSNDFQPSDEPHIDSFSSPLCEDPDWCAAVAQYRLTERNKELVNLSLVTFRDDPLAPGRTIGVVAPHAAVNGENIWLQHVEITVRNEPAFFQQQLRGYGGGLIPGGSSPDVGSIPLDI